MNACKACDSLFSEDQSIKNGHYFVYIPLLKQIETVLANAKLYSYLSNRNINECLNSLVVTDVVTSQLYKELITEHGLGPNDISLTWNTDGIPVFKSSNFLYGHYKLLLMNSLLIFVTKTSCYLVCGLARNQI
jgi:hypothetical protein